MNLEDTESAVSPGHVKGRGGRGRRRTGSQAHGTRSANLITGTRRRKKRERFPVSGPHAGSGNDALRRLFQPAAGRAL
ncbi:hypothetical protein AGOR_G00115160 [Albula goreensis]|uniref:Uncharacterized protein n=1 Tax=Albula goreensis TaxID=1534307 RepID=A0A8T3DF46_9TELE|nr:hypothetical protein AGOR_G00115160 [Albula goreensis]